jgi:hypothetical protein
MRNLKQIIEDKQKWTNRQEDCSAVDFAARGASEAADEAGGAGFAGNFFTETAAEARDGVANDFTANSTDFVVHPDWNVQPVRPEHNRSTNKYGITNQCKNAEC